MLCSRCKERQAVIFIATNNPGQLHNEGLCLVCAQEMGIEPINNILSQLGITEENVESVSDQLSSMMENPQNMQSLLSMMENPDALSGLFPSAKDGADSEDAEDTDEKDADSDLPFDQTVALLETDPAPSVSETDGDASNENKGEGGMSYFSRLFENMQSRREETANDTGSQKSRRNNNRKSKRKFLTSYCTNLTARAKNGELDRIIGRDRETGRVIQILSRRTKNNPCLIGEPGVGKTAIAEGLALRVVAGDVPSKLLDKEIFLLDLTALVAGTQFRGQFESRVKELISEVKSEGNIILFIDEVHNLVGAGDAEGSMNAANILKPALSRGEIQVIGATTFDEYRRHIEKDAALERRFQPVTIAEPSVDDTVDVIRGIREYYENFHRVKLPDELIRKTVVLSERYITDRYLPDKAIDLLDEACAHASLSNLRIAEYDAKNRELSKLQDLTERMTADNTNVNYEAVAGVRADIARLESDIAAMAPEVLGHKVTEDDLAHVIELWTGIPASRVKESEFKRLSGLEAVLMEKIIGQDEAVSAVASAIRRSRVQITPRRRPASFIFVGPTGSGKTELVKVLAAELFDSPETLIRLDMSEYMEKHSVSRIIGSPPGYVGYDESGQVTEKVRRRPYSVLLFDEIEKAHPDVLNVLLQILDEGRITDSHGRLVNFENTVIVMTSNAGSNKKDNALGFAKSEDELSREKAMKALSDFLRPEFISRIDEIIVFRTLTVDDYGSVAALMLSEYITTLGERGISFSFDEAATRWLAEHAHGGKSGARDLRNLIRREVEDKIATLLIDNADTPPALITLTVGEDEKLLLKTDINF